MQIHEGSEQVARERAGTPCSVTDLEEESEAASSGEVQPQARSVGCMAGQSSRGCPEWDYTARFKVDGKRSPNTMATDRQHPTAGMEASVGSG